MCVCGREAVVKVNNACDEAADISRRQTRHGGKFSFPWAFGVGNVVARKYREANRERGKRDRVVESGG